MKADNNCLSIEMLKSLKNNGPRSWENKKKIVRFARNFSLPFIIFRPLTARQLFSWILAHANPTSFCESLTNSLNKIRMKGARRWRDEGRLWLVLDLYWSVDSILMSCESILQWKFLPSYHEQQIGLCVYECTAMHELNALFKECLWSAFHITKVQPVPITNFSFLFSESFKTINTRMLIFEN